KRSHIGGKNGSDESVNRPNRSEKGSGALVVLAVLLLLLLVGGLVLSWRRWEGQAPIARFDREFNSLGRSPVLPLLVEDGGSGIRSVSVVLKQKEQSIPLVEEQYPGPSSLAFWRTGSLKGANFEIGKLIKEKYRVQEGPATLTVSVSDYALR